ncbi:hypothetical protein P692DRAFT_20839054 [Suillus brevipes Sb2]|nr:hypothetical protein P692DRAFT_20839054 [Suillus brevipes Sb2]
MSLSLMIAVSVNASCQFNCCLILHRKRDRLWSRAICSARVKHVHNDHINEPRGSGASLAVVSSSRRYQTL